jgi:hypothetical protein
MAPAAAHAAEGIISSIDVDSMPPFWRRKNGILLYFLLTSSLLASAALGIDGVSSIPLACELISTNEPYSP